MMLTVIFIVFHDGIFKKEKRDISENERNERKPVENERKIMNIKINIIIIHK